MRAVFIHQVSLVYNVELLEEEIKLIFDFRRNRIPRLLWQSYYFFLEGAQRFFRVL